MEERLISLLRLDAGSWTALALHWSLKLLLAMVVLVIGIRIARWLADFVRRAMNRAHVEPTATIFLGKVFYVTLLVTLVLAILQGVFDVAPTSLIAVLGAAGLAIGLALKDSLSNVASGVMLVSLKPFRVGDVVTIAGETGKVESISIFQTRLRGADNQTIVLPNSLITTDSIINRTPDTMRRIELVIGIDYKDDIDTARAAALEVMHADKRILAEPAADVLVYGLGDNSVNLGIRCHVSNADYFVTKCEIIERIKKAFDRVGVSIPFPQRDVRVFHQVVDQHQGVDQNGAAAPQYKLVAQDQGAASGKTGLDSSDHKPGADPK